MHHDFTQQTWNDRLVDDCRELIRLAVREDLDREYDWTTVALVPETSRAEAALVARTPGTVAGLDAVRLIIEETEADMDWSAAIEDGASVTAGETVGTLAGSARDVLTTERLILNLLSRLSGIATLTAAYVAQTHGTSAHIYDTRKTCPGYRRLDKYAVRCGGGRNHRLGLHEAIMIKDNHLAFRADVAAANARPIEEAVGAVRDFLDQSLPAERAGSMIIEVEVDSWEQFEIAISLAPDLILLDNMSPDILRQAVEFRDRTKSSCQLEASGGISLETVRHVAESGVDRISVGALTHSVAALDLGLDWRHGTPLPS